MTISALAPSTEPSQENILDNPDDVQSDHELYKEWHYFTLTRRKHKGLMNTNNETYNHSKANYSTLISERYSRLCLLQATNNTIHTGHFYRSFLLCNNCSFLIFCSHNAVIIIFSVK